VRSPWSTPLICPMDLLLRIDTAKKHQVRFGQVRATQGSDLLGVGGLVYVRNHEVYFGARVLMELSGVITRCARRYGSGGNCANCEDRRKGGSSEDRRLIVAPGNFARLGALPIVVPGSHVIVPDAIQTATTCLDASIATPQPDQLQQLARGKRPRDTRHE
jgi:hypothetical protein